MDIIKIEQLYQLKYSATVLNAIRQLWFDEDSYNFFGNKKGQHLISCFFNCSATYTLKDGTTICAPKNSVVYVPEESEYEITFSDCDASTEYNCISINFKLFDEQNTAFAFANGIKVYPLKQLPDISAKFHEIADNFGNAVCPTMKIAGLFYLLLSDLSSYCRVKKHILPKYNIISKGINVLENENLKDVKIDDLAKMCNVSPVYFRRLFKEYSGVTPVEYKLNTLITQAKQHLLFSGKNSSEIADVLGFSSHTYFCRIFKKKTGLTPTQFIKKQKEEM